MLYVTHLNLGNTILVFIHMSSQGLSIWVLVCLNCTIFVYHEQPLDDELGISLQRMCDKITIIGENRCKKHSDLRGDFKLSSSDHQLST